jgi:outer membrane protein assembly factor BamB
LHILEGRTGAEDTTFEAQHRSTLHASPLLYDIDFDGVLDIVVATYDGDIQFFRDTGAEASYRLFIPRLRVKHDWYAGLNPDPNDHSHPDVGADADDSGIGERLNRGRKRTEGAAGGGGGGAGGATSRRRSLLQVDVASLHNNANLLQREEITEEAAESFTELFADEEDNSNNNHGGGGGVEHEPDNSRDADWLDESNIYDEIEDEDYEIPFVGGDDATEQEQGDDGTNHVLHGGNVRHVRRGHRGRQERPHGHGTGHYNDDEFIEEETDDYFDLNAPPDDLNSENNNNGNSRDYQAKAEQWEDDTHTAPEEFSPEVDAPYVWIDAHVMATPSIADIDNDGRDELVVPVSYFFDPGDYSADSARARAAVGKDGDPGKYLASGIVVYDLHTRGIKWSQHLDLSTRYTRYKAEIYSIPTLADVDNDGRLEVIVGTSMGWVYVLDPKTGQALENWPVQLGDVQGQVAVGDVDNDGWLEIIAADARGSVVALRLNGKEAWERHLGSAIGAGATLADVDGDGKLEIIIGTFDGRIFVLDGSTGKDKPGFPFRTYGRITAPIMVTKLSDPKLPGLQLVATSHDGFLYVIDSLTACADSLDLGEPSYAMVLADDLAHTGRMDLLVATAGGNIYAIRTPARFQPLKVWPSQSPGPGTAGFVAKWNWEGIYATAASRVPRDVRGEAVQVRVTVVDNRPPLTGGKLHGPYRISVSLQGVGAKEMGMGDQPVIGMSNIVNKTGTYVMEIPCPRTRTSATIRVEMKDETGAVFSDEFALSFHIHFYRLLKWLAVGPFAFTAAAVLFMSGANALQVELPS